MDASLVTTTFTLEGYRIVRHLGVVRGVTVRSSWLGGQIVATLRSLGGGKITEYVKLCEETRQEAFDLMLRHADELGASAVVGVRFDATELGNNMTEVLAYGTAVIVQSD